VAPARRPTPDRRASSSQLHAGLARPAAFDADAPRHRDGGREHADGTLKTLPGLKLVELAAGNDFNRGQRPSVRDRGRIADHVDRVGEPRDRQVDRDHGRALVGDDNGLRGGFEARESGRHAIGAGRQAGDVKSPVAAAHDSGDPAPRRVDDFDVHTGERRRPLRPDGALDDTGRRRCVRRRAR
jgi:hypothetical protein